ncbi:MAG: Lrp/AsnC family transcriptional regulator [Candidatus Korarchaeota archaeon]|nr:Lrp/AsnC family transcriptional regulator [Candidatus Korarchaeota archaeon]
MLTSKLDVRIDEKDRRILNYLLENGRMSLKEIGEKLGISDVAVRKRIKKMEENGVIKGYTVRVDPRALGYSVVSLTGVDVEPGDLIRVARELTGREYVKSAWITAGDHSIMLEIWAKDEAEMDSIIEEISKMKGVTKICPAVVTQMLKARC